MSSNAVHMLYYFVIIFVVENITNIIQTYIQHTYSQSVYLITFITLELTPRRTLTGEYLVNLSSIMGQKKYMPVEHESNKHIFCSSLTWRVSYFLEDFIIIISFYLLCTSKTVSFPRTQILPFHGIYGMEYVSSFCETSTNTEDLNKYLFVYIFFFSFQSSNIYSKMVPLLCLLKGNKVIKKRRKQILLLESCEDLEICKTYTFSKW